MSKCKKTKANAGETLVEVLASMFLFMIMIGILQGAISYCNASLTKNKELRANNAVILQALQSQENVQEGANRKITFQATNSEFSALGSMVFSVDTRLDKKIISYQDEENQEQRITFCLYGSEENAAGSGTEGGGTSE